MYIISEMKQLPCMVIQNISRRNGLLTTCCKNRWHLMEQLSVVTTALCPVLSLCA